MKNSKKGQIMSYPKSQLFYDMPLWYHGTLVTGAAIETLGSLLKVIVIYQNDYRLEFTENDVKFIHKGSEIPGYHTLRYGLDEDVLKYIINTLGESNCPK